MYDGKSTVLDVGSGESKMIKKDHITALNMQ